MPTRTLNFATIGILAFGLCAVALAPVAVALPECVTTAPYTSQCTTGGSNQIVTSPPPNQFDYGYGGFGILGGGWPGLVIGIG